LNKKKVDEQKKACFCFFFYLISFSTLKIYIY
jgi:hypothetical protein